MNLGLTRLWQAPRCYSLVRQLSVNAWFIRYSTQKEPKPLSPRMQEFKKKLRETANVDDLDELMEHHPNPEEEALEGWPENTNPVTGEVGGPRGPEPTRYGDWERKGKVSDF